MYTLSNEFTAAAEARARQILVKALFNTTTYITGSNIIDMTVTEAVNASGGLSMGATISSKLSMTLKMPEVPIALNGGTVKPYVSFYGVTAPLLPDIAANGTLDISPTPTVDDDGTLFYSLTTEIDDSGTVSFFGEDTEEYCPLGKFYITEAASKDDFKSLFTLTAYDAFSKTEDKYIPTISMPNTAEAILSDIAGQCGFELSDDISFSDGEFDLYDYTCRQYIGFFAGIQGKNARFDRKGKLTFIWYKDYGYSVERSLQYMGGLKRLTSDDFNVQSITSGTDDNMFVAGNGTGISFENPFMTQETLDGIYSTVGSFSYTPAQLKWRGNPVVEAGDIIVADDKDGISRKIYVMEQTLKISGGLYSEIKCYGESEAAIHFNTSPQSKKIQQAYTKLQEAIRDATKLLNGANGGVFEVTDEDSDGINDGWIIHSADGNKFIKANVNGIGLTTNGGAEYRNAMTPDGINADAITVGHMSAERISVGDASLGDVFSVEADSEGHPVVTIGSSENDIKQKQTNDAITFVNGSEAQVAKFSVTGAEWSDFQEMRYCSFVWTKSNVTGNVRFTKAAGGDE